MQKQKKVGKYRILMFGPPEYDYHLKIIMDVPSSNKYQSDKLVAEEEYNSRKKIEDDYRYLDRVNKIERYLTSERNRGLIYRR